VVRSASKEDAPRRERLNRQADIFLQSGHIGDANVDPAFNYVADDLSGVRRQKRYPDTWMGAGDAGDSGGYRRFGHVGPGGNSQRSFDQSREQPYFSPQVRFIPEPSLASFEQQPTEHGGRYTLVRSIEQPNAKHALQCRNASGDAGLGQIE
jgi:hypothetical protein